MAYYIRVLSPESDPGASSGLRKVLADAGLTASLSGDTERDEWEQLIVAHPGGSEICAIERNEVAEDGLGREEIDEFLEELEDGEPRSAADWLTTYLSSIRSIYAIQILKGTEAGNGWDIVSCLKTAIWNAAGGIIQADNEGVTSEEGYHILWQFRDDAAGDWWMAVLDNGRWRRFRMDLANADHRAAFVRGEVPASIEMID